MVKVLQRRKVNPKRRLLDGKLSGDRTAMLKHSMRYCGSPLHKKSPGDFGLTPPAAPRPGKSLCDATGIFTVAEATALLHRGVEAGLVSDDQSFPRYVWAVLEARQVVEARCDDPVRGTYHGYPLEKHDPMAELVLQRWREQEK
ncbi:hypothetical protein ACHHRT_12940 [Desulfurivibrio sp. D14AmB]|uniref:hypothetical protein n=1 Tax=Desulfurivibrio sp. D14AmB TaxID=3374370 RepID=UPI00376F14B0